jgi:hypothetical protein
MSFSSENVSLRPGSDKKKEFGNLIVCRRKKLVKITFTRRRKKRANINNQTQAIRSTTSSCRTLRKIPK